MNRRWVVLAAFVLLAAAVMAAYTVVKEPHRFGPSQCNNCHLDVQGRPAMLSGPITRLCAQCHLDTIMASSHPVDIKPVTVRVPTDMPLRDGRITCSTCHNVHAESTLVFGIKSYMLRRATADMKYFCIVCHPEDRRNPDHSDLLIVAHTANKFVPTGPDGSIDPLSLECMGCHDGSIGSGAEYGAAGGIWMHDSGSHPIGVSYREARMQGATLVATSQLDARLKLFDGRIGCGTCHDMYALGTSKLVMDNTESILCRSCHYDK